MKNIHHIVPCQLVHPHLQPGCQYLVTSQSALLLKLEIQEGPDQGEERVDR